ncbi:MAG: PAS domain S-box protein [Acidobacteria bacterium]|jgi:PAS domain S-box-containing protein|nr:MAG: PAS domain S-box protein [Acidobacteriota bacterium]
MKMLVPKPSRSQVVNSASDLDNALEFIADLGRSLAGVLHPKKIADKVASSLVKAIGAKVCAVVVELEKAGLVSSAFTSEGELENFLNKTRFKQWIQLLPAHVSIWVDDKEDFFLDLENHNLEYVSPIFVGGRVKGAIILGFHDLENCAGKCQKLIEATTQILSIGLNSCENYDDAIDTSVSYAKEENQRFIEAILDALPVSLYVVDRNYRIIAWNKNRELGLQGVAKDEVIGRSIFEVLSRYPESDLRFELERIFRTGKIQRIEQKMIDADGTTRHWLISKVPMRDPKTGEITHVITIGEDITARVEAIQAIARAEKLAAVGRLAAGVVHEINNPLATIAACAESLENRLQEGAFKDSPEIEDFREYLSLIRSEAFRCKTITNSLLDFSRARSGHRIPLDVNSVISSSVRLLEHQRKRENISIQLELEENLPLIKADEGQIQQAIIALATNAVDAMPNGGILTFRTFSRFDKVFIEVQDTGIGIPPENLPQIFEPFFTTKEIGKGTGLGLAVCYGIVTEHQGKLTVRSKVGEGSTFTMSFPIFREQEE